MLHVCMGQASGAGEERKEAEECETCGRRASPRTVGEGGIVVGEGGIVAGELWRGCGVWDLLFVEWTRIEL